MGAELYAISRALHWLVLNQPLLSCSKVVILSDSKSGIMAISNCKSRSNSFLTNQIRNLADILDDNELKITIQWIPSHMDIPANNHVDGLAKSGHNLPEETRFPLAQKEMKKLIRSNLQRICQLKYEADDQLHIIGIKRKLEHWPWASSKIDLRLYWPSSGLDTQS